MATKNHTIPVRLDSKTKGRLDRAKKSSGIPKSELMRLSILKGLDEIESGYLKLPKTAK